MTRPPIPVVRVIARLNIGGPAIQAISLTALMQARGYATRLVRGTESADEGNMDDLARRMGVHPTLVASMRGFDKLNRRWSGWACVAWRRSADGEPQPTLVEPVETKPPRLVTPAVVSDSR